MFTTFIVQPIFNLLVLIYAILPGHNFGLSLIIFTIIIRLLLWPLVRKQLHQARAMRKLQPEIKRIKQEAKGDRQKESLLLMNLYKEKGINPIGTFPILVIQIIILLGLYSGLTKVTRNPHELVSFAYPSLQHLPWIEQLSKNIHLFDNTLFGIIDLSKAAIGPSGFYLPAFLLVAGSAYMQFQQSKQLMPKTENQRSLREIMREASSGKQADQAEVNAAVSNSTRFLIPGMIFVFTIQLPAALSLYWLTGGIAAYIQQALILREDETEMEAIADKPGGKRLADIPEAEIVDDAPAKTKTTRKPAKKGSAKKRRKK